MLDLDKSTWQRVKFGEVVKNANAKSTDPVSDGIDRVIAMEHLDPGELAITRWGSLDTGTTFTRRVVPGQTLFGKRRAYQRKVAYAEFNAICSGDILTFEAVAGKLLPELLPFIVQSDPFFERAVGTSAGSLSPRTNWRDLAKFEFDLPPLDEQKRISDLLWAVERHSRSVQNLILRQNDAYADLRFMLLLGSTITPERNPRNQNCILPPEWEMKRISDIGNVKAGGTPSRRKQTRYFDGGNIPWVKSLDLNEGTIRDTDESITKDAISESNASRVPAGTVLVAMYGGFNQIGRTGILGVDGATNQAVSAITNLSGDVRPRYLHEALKAGRASWKSVAASSRKDPNITKKDVENFSFPVPPIPIQDEIIQRLDTLNVLTIARLDEMKKIRAMRSSLLSSIFGDS